jgi:hypothetical protein
LRKSLWFISERVDYQSTRDIQSPSLQVRPESATQPSLAPEVIACRADFVVERALLGSAWL